MNLFSCSYQVEEPITMKPFPNRRLARCLTMAAFVLALVGAALAQPGSQAAGTGGQAAPDGKKPAASAAGFRECRLRECRPAHGRQYATRRRAEGHRGL